MPRKFRSNRTDVRKKAKYPVQRKRMSEKQKKTSAEQRLLRSLKAEAASAPHSGYGATRKANANLAVVNQCQTIIGGRKVWVAAKKANGQPVIRNGKVVRYPAIIIPDENPDGHRCPKEAITSRKREGATEHKCASHLGVWYVDVEGRRRNYDDEIIG